jgi:ABC-2 type transport system ATP-binding protein
MRTCVSEVYVEPGARRLTAHAGGLDDMTRIGAAFADSRISVDDLGLKRPSLDDVFLHLTGHRAEERPDTDPDDDSPDAALEAPREGALR